MCLAYYYIAHLPVCAVKVLGLELMYKNDFTCRSMYKKAKRVSLEIVLQCEVIV